MLSGEQNNYHIFSYEYVFNNNQMCLKFCCDQSTLMYSARVYLLIWIHNFNNYFDFLFSLGGVDHPPAYWVPGPGIRSEPQLWPTLQLQQHWILNPLYQAGDQTHVPVILLHYSGNFFFFRAAPTAYGSSQTGGQIRAVASSLYHSSWQRQIRDPLSKASDLTRILMDTSRAGYCWAMMGNSYFSF